MSKKKPLFSDENKVKELIEMYTGGASLRDCAAHFGCSAPTVSSALKSNNVQMNKVGANLKPKKKIISISEDELKSVWESMSQEKIAEHFGVSVDTIVDRGKAFGLTREHELRNKIRHETNVSRYGENYRKSADRIYVEKMIELYGRG